MYVYVLFVSYLIGKKKKKTIDHSCSVDIRTELNWGSSSKCPKRGESIALRVCEMMGSQESMQIRRVADSSMHSLGPRRPLPNSTTTRDRGRLLVSLSCNRNKSRTPEKVKVVEKAGNGE
jgi:hypothetical protein